MNMTTSASCSIAPDSLRSDRIGLWSGRCSTAREITIESREGDIVTCLDGEIFRSRRAALRLSEKKVRFFGPPGCDPNATCQPLPVPAGTEQGCL